MERKPFGFNFRTRKSGIGDAINFHPKAKRTAYIRLGIVKALREAILTRGGKSMGEVYAEVVALYNAGLILPEIFPKPKTISRSSLYGWNRLHKKHGFLGLIPKYRWRFKSGAVVIPIKPSSYQKKTIAIPGQPRRISKYEILPKIRSQWNGPTLDGPIQLSIFYLMGIPKGTKMRRRTRMLRREISHIGKPNLDSLNAFMVDCVTGIVFKDHSQIVRFYSEKRFGWFPKIDISVQPLK